MFAFSFAGVAMPATTRDMRGLERAMPGMEVPGTAPEEIWAFAPGKRRQLFARARGGVLVDA